LLEHDVHIDRVPEHDDIDDEAQGAELVLLAFTTEAENEITARLARTLNLEIVKAAGRRIEQERAADPDARDLVMRGWAWYYRSSSKADRLEAQRRFEQALEMDPGSVDARVGIARILVGNMVDGWSSCFQQDEARAEQLLLEAVERDANSAMARATMGYLREFQNRLPESRLEFETAIALDRNNANTIAHLGIALMLLGQPEAAIPQIESAIRLNPPRAGDGWLLLGIGYLPSSSGPCGSGDRSSQEVARGKSLALLYPSVPRGGAWFQGRSRRGEDGSCRDNKAQT
jgi:tetratricopeptide (TPR) repeat protein